MRVVLKIGGKRALWRKTHMSSLLPEFKFYLVNEPYNLEEIEYAIVWKPERGWLKMHPNLKCIISLGSGIDHITCDPELPKGIPIIRTTSEDMNIRMREYVTLHVLRHHRKLSKTEAAQKSQNWDQIIEPPANQRHIGIMGLGNLGEDCARTLASIGFQVSGWSKSKKEIKGVNCFWGNHQRDVFVKKSEILICMLPLTKKTEGILNSSLFSLLPKAASIINVARGEHLVEKDLLSALESGQLESATLDVFSEEPLRKNHPFWDHPKVLVTPHIASLIDPVSGGKSIAANLKKFIAGEYIDDLIPPGRDY